MFYIDYQEENQSNHFSIPTGGKPIPIEMYHKRQKKRQFSVENLRRLQNSRNFSDNDIE